MKDRQRHRERQRDRDTGRDRGTETEGRQERGAPGWPRPGVGIGGGHRVNLKPGQ